MSTVTRLRTHRRTVVVVTLVVLLLVVLSVLSVGAARHGGDLDPENPGASGAQAVARVLADHGVARDRRTTGGGAGAHAGGRPHHGAGHLTRAARTSHGPGPAARTAPGPPRWSSPRPAGGSSGHWVCPSS